MRVVFPTRAERDGSRMPGYGELQGSGLRMDPPELFTPSPTSLLLTHTENGSSLRVGLLFTCTVCSTSAPRTELDIQ